MWPGRQHGMCGARRRDNTRSAAGSHFRARTGREGGGGAAVRARTLHSPPAPIAQLAEAADLKSVQCRFESDWGHARTWTPPTEVLRAPPPLSRRSTAVTVLVTDGLRRPWLFGGSVWLRSARYRGCGRRRGPNAAVAAVQAAGLPRAYTAEAGGEGSNGASAEAERQMCRNGHGQPATIEERDWPWQATRGPARRS